MLSVLGDDMLLVPPAYELCPPAAACKAASRASGALSARGVRFQEHRKQIVHTLEQGGKVVMAPARLLKTCFCPGYRSRPDTIQS